MARLVQPARCNNSRPDRELPKPRPPTTFHREAKQTLGEKVSSLVHALSQFETHEFSRVFRVSHHANEGFDRVNFFTVGRCYLHKPRSLG